MWMTCSNNVLDKVGYVHHQVYRRIQTPDEDVWISKESSTELKKNRKISAETSERMGSAVLILCSFVDEMDIYLLFPHTGVDVAPCQVFCAPALIGLVNKL